MRPSEAVYVADMLEAAVETAARDGYAWVGTYADRHVWVTVAKPDPTDPDRVQPGYVSVVAEQSTWRRVKCLAGYHSWSTYRDRPGAPYHDRCEYCAIRRLPL